MSYQIVDFPLASNNWWMKCSEQLAPLSGWRMMCNRTLRPPSSAVFLAIKIPSKLSIQSSLTPKQQFQHGRIYWKMQSIFIVHARTAFVEFGSFWNVEIVFCMLYFCNIIRDTEVVCNFFLDFPGALQHPFAPMPRASFSDRVK